MSDIPKVHGRKKRHTSSSSSPSNVPPCYGDSRHYDLADPECRSCHVKVRCGIKTNKTGSSTTITSSSSYTKSKVSGSSTGRSSLNILNEDDLREDDDLRNPIGKNAGGFFRTLAHNTWVRGTSMFLREAAYGVDTIPLEQYPLEPREK